MASNKKITLIKKIDKNIKKRQSVSKQSQLAERVLWLSRSKVTFQSVEAADKMIVARFEKNRLKRNLPKLKSDIYIDNNYLTEVYHFTKESNDNKKVIIYLHGGAYINQPARFHWKFVDKLVQKTNYNVVFPLYPKAPEFNIDDCYEYLIKLYNDLMKNGYEDVIFMGDSAGGGLALGFAIYLKNTNLIKPSKIILLSPWVDISMINDKVDKLEIVDPMLSRIGLLEIGKVWANGNDLNEYRLSPLFGDLSNLGEITIFVGTHELFLYDNRLLRDKLIENNMVVNYYEYKYMNHAFVLFPIPEASKATNIIIDMLNK